MTSATPSKNNTGAGSATQTVRDINKSPSATASVNAANKAEPSMMDKAKSVASSAGATADKALGGYPGKAYDAVSSGVDKMKSLVGLKEEVQVGDNKYRII